MREYSNEELDELHNHIYAFFTFFDEDSIIEYVKDEVSRNHCLAMAKRINEIIEEHGGRFYKPLPKR